MKKMLFLICAFLFFPIVSLAVDYDISHYHIDARILENGDMEVIETIVLDGTFNGYERDILYLGNDKLLSASGIENLVVSGKYYEDKEDYNTFERVSSATNGDKEKYILSNLSGGYRIRMYYATKRSETAFKISYTLKDVVIVHNNFAEVYWNFIGSDFEDPISDLKIKVTLPRVDNSDYFRIWAHGEMNGEINFNNTDVSSGLIATSDYVSKYTPTDIRLTFDKNLVNASLISKKSDETLEDIIAKEEVLAKEQNELRKKVKNKYYFTVGLSTIFYIYTITSFIYIFKKHDKERNPNFKLKYNREFIDDYNVEVIDYLMNRNITDNAMSASIMNLIYKKNIKAEAIPEVKNGYKFTLLNRDNLNDAENKLVDFLFEKIGTNNEFTTVALKKYASRTKTCNTFINTYTAWKKQVISDGVKQGFFETNKSYILFPIISMILGTIIVAYMGSNNVEFIFGNLAIFVAIVYFIYALCVSKRTQKGVEHYAKWKAFKNFLNDFGNFSVKELPEVILWERYLVYATIFGLADKLEKVMNVRIKEIDTMDAATGMYLYNDHLVNIHIANSINSTMHSAVRSSQVAVNRMNASSSMSSGSGFGGGFSGGGGFGGGGGGGRGF